jgi:hypothetical protein
MLSPVSLDNSSAIWCASWFLIFSIFYLSTANYQPLYHQTDKNVTLHSPCAQLKIQRASSPHLWIQPSAEDGNRVRATYGSEMIPRHAAQAPARATHLPLPQQ